MPSPLDDCSIHNPHGSIPTAVTDRNPLFSGESGSVPESNLNAPGNSGRAVHSRRLPARFRDTLPEPPLSLPTSSLDSGAASMSADSESSEATLSPQSFLPHVILHVFDSLRTSFNTFSIAREYHHRPSYDPDSFLTIDQLANTIHEPLSDGVPSPDASLPQPPPWPWKNMGIW